MHYVWVSVRTSHTGFSNALIWCVVLHHWPFDPTHHPGLFLRVVSAGLNGADRTTYDQLLVEIARASLMRVGNSDRNSARALRFVHDEYPKPLNNIVEDDTDFMSLSYGRPNFASSNRVVAVEMMKPRSVQRSTRSPSHRLQY